MKKIILLYFILSNSLYGNIIRSDEHCVAWKAKKTSFFFSKSNPVGKNCDIDVSLVEMSGLYQLHLIAPLKSFNSDNGQRDKDVMGILEGDKFPNIEFKSTAAPLELWEQIFELGRGILTGKITIAGKDYDIDCPITISSSGDIVILSGALGTHLTSLNIEPPSVLLGAIARVDDSLEFHYRIRLDKVKSGEVLSSLLKKEPKK